MIKPLSHQTAMLQRMNSVQKICQRALGSPRNMHKTSNLPVTACTQRPNSVPTASTWRSHRVLTASMALLRRERSCCSVLMARKRRAYSVHSVEGFILLIFCYILSNTILLYSELFGRVEAIRHSIYHFYNVTHDLKMSSKTYTKRCPSNIAFVSSMCFSWG